MLLQLAESLRCAATAQERTAHYHVTLTLLHVCEPVLKLEYLIAMPAFYSDLVDDVI